MLVKKKSLEIQLWERDKWIFYLNQILLCFTQMPFCMDYICIAIPKRKICESFWENHNYIPDRE